jgi:transposase InsO family protein
VPRSTYYYQPQPESEENLRLMRKLDQLYMKLPFFGSRKMAVELGVGRPRARRLMGVLGIEAHYPKPHLSRPAPAHQIYPYLLRGVAIERPNQVWSTDITYLPMRGGFLYLVAVMDWYSRFVLSWELSNTMETASAWRLWKPRSVSASPKSGTPIKARSSPPSTSWLRSNSVASGSAWMAAVARSTTFSEVVLVFWTEKGRFFR